MYIFHKIYVNIVGLACVKQLDSVKSEPSSNSKTIKYKITNK